MYWLGLKREHGNRLCRDHIGILLHYAELLEGDYVGESFEVVKGDNRSFFLWLTEVPAQNSSATATTLRPPPRSPPTPRLLEAAPQLSCRPSAAM